MKRINIFSTNNGVGLYQDYLVLKSALEKDFDIHFIDIHAPHYHQADINLHLEIIRSKNMHMAPVNIAIPNPEWFFPDDKIGLGMCQAVFAKTRCTEEIFKKLHKETVFTSFTSVDKFMPNVKKENIFLHVSGKSDYKGTTETIAAWPGNGTLFLTSSKQRTMIRKPGIEYNVDHMAGDQMQLLMNACKFHICCSESEGFGHHMNEARSTGAIIITTNAAPMNEFVDNDSGIIVNTAASYPIRFGYGHKISIPELTKAINHARELPEDEIRRKSELIRKNYLNNDLYFRKTVLSLLKKF